MKRGYSKQLFRAVMLALPLSVAWCQTSTWTGSGAANTNWSNASNWDSLPTSDVATTILQFPASSSIQTLIDTDFSAKGLIFQASSPVGVTINASSVRTLTLGSAGILLSDSVQAYLNGSLTLHLATAQTWEAATPANGLWVTSTLTGSSTLTKTGTGLLFLSADSSSFSGDIVVSNGSLAINNSTKLGSGHLSLASGASLALYDPNASLSNAVTLGASTNIWHSAYVPSAKVTLTGDVTFSDTASTTSINPDITLGIQGTVSGPAGTVWTISGGGNVFHDGSTDASISKIQVDIGTLFFTKDSAVPSGTNSIVTSSVGIVSLVGDGSLTSNTTLWNKFFASVDAANFAGILSLDTVASPTIGTAYFAPATFDLSAFTNTGFRFGSSTKAELGSAPTMPAGMPFRFGGGGGELLVTASLSTTSTGLVVDSPTGTKPLTVILQGDNSGLSSISVNRSLLVFDSYTAFPASAGTLSLGANSYVSFTERSSYFGDPAGFVSRISWADSSSVLGFDKNDLSHTHYLQGDITFSGSTPYIGTRANLDIPVGKTVKAASADNTLRFVALPGATITHHGITSSQAQNVTYGHPDSTFTGTGSNVGTYLLSSASTYTGETLIYGGQFNLGPYSALGFGQVTIPSGAASVRFRTDGTDAYVINNIKADSPLTLGLDLNSMLSIGGNISGSGKITVQGAVDLFGINTYTGGTDILTGASVRILGAGAFGASSSAVTTGENVVLDYVGGPGTISYGNAFSLGNGFSFAANNTNAATLVFTGNTTLVPYTGYISTTISPKLGIRLQGTIGTDTATDTTWSVSKGSNATGGRLILEGALSSTIKNVIADGTSVVFTDASGIPQTIASSNGGLLGLSSTTPANVTSFLAAIPNPSFFNGTIGFESFQTGTNTYFNGDALLDLSAFTSTNYRIGSTSKAILAPNTLKVAADADFRFGNGGGVLTLATSLIANGVNNLNISSDFSSPLTVELRNPTANTFTGNVLVDNSLLTIGADDALPAGALIMMNSQGGNAAYVSYTPNASTSFADFGSLVSRVKSGSESTLVVGYDAVDTTAAIQTTLVGDLDFSALKASGTVFFGTRSRELVIPGGTTIKAANGGDGDDAIGFVAFDGGRIILNAPLNASRIGSVSFGAPVESSLRSGHSDGAYSLYVDNNYTGGTTLNGGTFNLYASSPFGTGTICINSGAGNTTLLPETARNVTIAGNVIANNGVLNLGASGGTLTLAGGLTSSADIDINGPVYLTGATTTYGSIYVVQGPLVFGNYANCYGEVVLNSGQSILVPERRSSMAGEATFHRLSLQTNAILGLNKAVVASNEVYSGDPSNIGYSSDSGSTLGRITTSNELNLFTTAANQTFSTQLGSGLVLTSNGTVFASYSGAKWVVTKDANSGLRGGSLVLNGTTGANVSSITADAASIFFSTNSLSASLTKIQSLNGGLVGFIGQGGGEGYAPANTTGLLGMIGRLTDVATFNGTLSLDTDSYFNSSTTSAAYFGGNATTIDLSAFQAGSITLGSSTYAILAADTALLFPGTVYAFGGGKGVLEVRNNLGGSKSLSVDSSYGDSQNLILKGTNTFTGGITVKHSSLLLGSSGALPATGSLLLQNSSYLGYTPETGLSLNTLLSRFDSGYDSTAILGVDTFSTGTFNTANEVRPQANINLSALPRSLYIGTSTEARLPGYISITAPSADNTLKFAAIRGGKLIVDTLISGSTSVVYGHPDAALVGTPGTYTITGNNTYTGGTTLYNGSFSLTRNSVFGTGAIDIEGTGSAIQFNPGYMAKLVFANNISLNNNATLILGSSSYSADTSLEISGIISNGATGTGSVVTHGGVTLSGANTYSGGTWVNSGALLIKGSSPLGAGAVHLLDGATLKIDGDTQIGAGSTIDLGSNVSLLSSAAFPNSNTLTIQGNVSASSASQSLGIGAGLVAQFKGQLTSTTAETAWRFAPPSSDASFGGISILAGTTSSDIASFTADKTAIIFADSGTLPSVSIKALNGGIIGIAGDSGLMNMVLAKIDPCTFQGVISFDSPLAGSTASYGGSINPINLSNFSAGSVSLGSLTKAIIESDTVITPAAGENYKFGGGGGKLIVNASLDANTGVSLDSPENFPLTLVLGGANTFTGQLEVNGSYLIINSNGALPGSASDKRLVLGVNSYASYTNLANDTFATPAAFLSRISSAASSAVVGFDNADPTQAVSFLGGTSIDLSSFTNAFYIGTASKLITLDTGNTLVDAMDGYFKVAAFQGATIDIQANLNAVDKMVYGHPDTKFAADRSTGALGTYILRPASNTSTQTTLYDGTYLLGNNNAFGSGLVMLGASSTKVSIAPYVDASQSIYSTVTLGSANGLYTTVNSFVHLGSTIASTPASLRINGIISGSGQLDLSGTVTLGGANTYSGGTLIAPSIVSTITVTQDSGLGIGDVELGPNASLVFESSAPKVYNLHSTGGGMYLANGSTLTITQSKDNKLATDIRGGSPSSPATTTAAVSFAQSAGVTTYVTTGGSNYSGGTLIENGTVALTTAGTPLGTGQVTLKNATLILGTAALSLPNQLNFTGTTNKLVGLGTLNNGGNTLVIDSLASLSAFIPNSTPGGETYSTGVLTLSSNVTFGNGGELKLGISDPAGSAGIGYSKLSVQGTLNFADNAVFKLSALNIGAIGTEVQGSYTYGQTYSLVVASANSITNFDNSKIVLDTTQFASGLVPSWNFNLANGDKDLVLNFTPVPEPETWAMMLGGSAAVLLPLLRRRKQSKNDKAA